MIHTVYQAVFCDTPCDHAHKTFDAAERCAKKTIRRAWKGPPFGHPADSELIANTFTPEQAEQCVRKTTRGD